MNIGIDILCMFAAAICGMMIAAFIVYGIPYLFRKAVSGMNQKDRDTLNECTDRLAYRIEMLTETMHKIELQQMRIASTLAQLYYSAQSGKETEDEKRD